MDVPLSSPRCCQGAQEQKRLRNPRGSQATNLLSILSDDILLVQASASLRDWSPRYCSVPFICVFLGLLKDAALHVEPKKEKMEPDLEQGEKQRLDSVTSSESFASSGFQEDKSLSDAEEEEGRY